jgi:lipopolysaccharide/colanic/teichoic acid biosynthesis glycosyltransferase
MSTSTATITSGPRDLATLEMLYGIPRNLETDFVSLAPKQGVTALTGWELGGMETAHPAVCPDRLRGKVWTENRPQIGPKIPAPDSRTYSGSISPSKQYLLVKTVLDFIGAVFVLIIAAPVMTAVALAIKLTSPGAVLFRQIRVGQNGREFILYKFRSMPEDVEVKTGPTWSGDGDLRATPVGRFLRKFHLDELPQVFNVLRCEMSLVGPRPERPCFVRFLRQLIPNFDLRHCVKPGITGLAQVCYAYGASVKDASKKLRYELFYARHVSLRFDLLVLAKTIKVVLAGQGS